MLSDDKTAFMCTPALSTSLPLPQLQKTLRGSCTMDVMTTWSAVTSTMLKLDFGFRKTNIATVKLRIEIVNTTNISGISVVLQ